MKTSKQLITTVLLLQSSVVVLSVHFPYSLFHRGFTNNTNIMRCGCVFCCSWGLAIFLLLAFPFSDHMYSGRSLSVSSCCRQIWKTQVLLSTVERWVFTYGLQVTCWFYANEIVSMNKSADYAFFVCFVRPVRPRFLRLRKVRRQSRPCNYYANTVSTFEPLLEGDLVFKLNPGPDKIYQIPSRSADGGRCRQGTKR